MSSQNSFYECLDKITDLNNYIKEFTTNHLTVHANDPKLKLLPLKIKEFNRYLTTNLHEDLHQLKWVIHILDREQDKDILKRSYQSLNTLVNALNLTSSRLYDVQCHLKHSEFSHDSGLIDPCLETINKFCSRKEILSTIAETTHNMLKSVYDLENEEIINPPESLVTDSSQGSARHTEIISTHDEGMNVTSRLNCKIVFSDLFPKTLYIHDFHSHGDNEYAKQDVREMMQGISLQTHLSKFETPNKYGSFIEVPYLFCVDLPRSELLMLNETCLFNAKQSHAFNLNDAALALYRIFGKRPAIRLMNLCHQSAVSFMYIHYIYSLIQEGGAFRNKIPLQGELIGTNDELDGLIHKIKINDKTQYVEISSKMKFTIKSDQDINNDIKVQLVVKRIITLPLQELKAKDFETSLHPAPNLDVKDFVTEPIVNDPKWADEILKML
jgi:hypothetical protein